jgi:hypothetical protein
VEKLFKEIAVTVEGKPPNYFQLLGILKTSQEMAERQFGATALAVYKVEPMYGR